MQGNRENLGSLHSFTQPKSMDQGTTGGLALFCNKPKECRGCGSAAVAYMCEKCEDWFVCEDCRFDRELMDDHDIRHPIVSLVETHCNSSRTFGGDSYSLMTVDGNTSSLFYDPCSVCGQSIEDTEVVYRCEQCNLIMCERCYKNPANKHEHELRRFKRRARSSNVPETTLVNKSRSSDGNKIINDYVVVKVLGQGSFAKVKLVQHIRTRELFALKILKRKRKQAQSSGIKRSIKTTNVEMDEDDLLREIAVMKFIDHPNVVQLKEVIEDVDSLRVYIIMEYCERGPVHILGRPPLPISQVRKYGSDILRGILHLHSEFLYHRDIKPANCLVDAYDTVKLADFGTCNSRAKADTQQTPAFSTPEQIRGESVIGSVVDSWSFALTLYQMAFGRLPYSTTSLYVLRNELMSPDPVNIGEDGDAQLTDLLRRMLCKDLSRRLMVEAAATHPFFGLEMDSQRNVRRVSKEVQISSPSNQELYKKAAQEVRRGKNLNECFHGVKAIRTLRNKEANYAAEKGVANALEADEEGWLYDLDSNNNSVLELEGVNDRSGVSTASITDFVQQASAGALQPDHTTDRAGPEVLALIRKCVEAKDRKLQLLKLPMGAPPAELSDVAPYVTEMRLSYNGLQRMSLGTFASFSLLKDITITFNKLAVFPEELLQAPRLLRLDLSTNRIADIPPAVARARFLQRLNLHNNLITQVGTGADGRSVLASPCLRHVRLSSNPLRSIPSALDTTNSLELVMDTIPALTEAWDALVQRCMPDNPPALVVWDDYFPERIRDCAYPIWVASSNLALYRVHTLTTCAVQHAVLFQCNDTRFPCGFFPSKDLTTYFIKLAARVSMAIQQTGSNGSNGAASPTRSMGSRGSGTSLGDPAERARHGVAKALRTLPSVVSRSARNQIQSYFFISDNLEDSEGGYKKLCDFIREVLQARESIIFFMTPGSEGKDARDIATGALAEIWNEQTHGTVDQVHG
ncbi:protein kinase [Strigomonas culicis]|uniref:Protein kinase n=1 Tax=Strigomonas culicis TaxID=28005 RepID=S9VFE0_9TRYP|nr:protein kinase [Strigomonas culicis]|eukprot:EPY25771.1 protein kinase [Strigomonas culicis]